MRGHRQRHCVARQLCYGFECRTGGAANDNGSASTSARRIARKARTVWNPEQENELVARWLEDCQQIGGYKLRNSCWLLALNSCHLQVVGGHSAPESTPEDTSTGICRGSHLCFIRRRPQGQLHPTVLHPHIICLMSTWLLLATRSKGIQVRFYLSVFPLSEWPSSST